MDVDSFEEKQAEIGTIIQELVDGSCSREKGEKLYKRGLELISRQEQRINGSSGSTTIIGDTIDRSEHGDSQ